MFSDEFFPKAIVHISAVSIFLVSWARLFSNQLLLERFKFVLLILFFFLYKNIGELFHDLSTQRCGVFSRRTTTRTMIFAVNAMRVQVNEAGFACLMINITSEAYYRRVFYIDAIDARFI